MGTEKRETALEPFPFQLICFISSEVCFHHLLPGLVSQCNVWFHRVIIFMSSVRWKFRCKVTPFVRFHSDPRVRCKVTPWS